MTRANGFVRDHARNCGVYFWQIADALGINEGSFSRMLRYELSKEKRREIIDVIDRLAMEVLRNE